MLLFLFSFGVGQAWGGTSVYISSFSNASSGSIDSNISYSTGNGVSVNSPTIDSNRIKLFRGGSSGNKLGNYITVSAASGYTITAITFTIASSLQYSYSVNGGSASTATNTSLALSNQTATSVTFQNKSNSQMFLTRIDVTYSGGCDKKVTVTKSSATNGSFTLKAGSASGTTINNSGTVDNCDANATIVVIPSANTHYHVSGVTASNKTTLTGPDASGNYTITYTKGSNISTTIGVTFAEDTKYTLNYHDGSGSGTRTNVYEGTNLIEALGTPAASCDATSTTFKGWSTSEIATKTNTAPTYVAANAVVNSTTAAATYYAVYAKEARKNTTTTFERLTNKNQIKDGMYVILIQGSNNALNTSFSRTELSSGTTLSNPASTVKWTAEISGTKFKFKNGSGNYIGTSSTSNNTAISSNGTYQSWDIITEKGSYSGAWGLNNGNDLEYYSSTFKVYAWSSSYKSSFPWYIYIPQATYEDYMTTCCTPLGSINGSFNRTQSCPIM